MITYANRVLLILSSSIALVSPQAARTRDSQVHPIFVVEPSALNQGNSANATITVDVAGQTPTQINLTSSNTGLITAPASVTIPAGETQVTFTVTASSSGTGSASITASANGEEATGNLTAVSTGG